MSGMRSPLAAFHPSNLLTYASLGSGIAALGAAAGGSRGGAAALVALAVIFDTFDGKFARLFARTEAERAIGVQLDSLSDAIAFGIVPAVTLVLLGTSPSPLWWVVAFGYAACAITRLAFYNVTHETTDGFVGLPAPVAALIWATALLANPGGVTSTLVAGLTAAAMVVPLPVPRPRGVAFAAFVCWPLVLIVVGAAA